MRLSEFIEKRRKKIVDEWVAFAATLHPWAEGMSKKALRDHAEEMLSAIIADIKTPQSARQQAQKSKGGQGGGPLGEAGKKHAVERLESGLPLSQLVSEYRALRASVLRLWEAEQGDEGKAMTRFNEAIDETLAESAVWYSAKVAETREHFLAILGHDLRNPLASIIMGAAMLARSSNSDIKQLGVATRIGNSAERMSRMVNDLLDLTRTRLGAGMPVAPKSMDLAPVAQQVIEELAAVHPDRILRFESDGDLRGEWDGDRLNQVISNLVANALQHGSEDAPVTLVAKPHGDDVVVRVHNEGSPISANALKTIFEPMVRLPAEKAADANPTGLGLGLYIAREIVTAHGGTIGVTSTEEGTTFTVRLPRRAAKKHGAEQQPRGTRSARPRTRTRGTRGTALAKGRKRAKR